MADVLGKKEDATKFRTLYEKRKEFFNKTFVNAEKKTLGLIGGGRGFGGEQQLRRNLKWLMFRLLMRLVWQ